MFCEKCGKALNDDSSFCQYCGAAVERHLEEDMDKVDVPVEQSADRSPEFGKRTKLLCLIGAGVVILAAIIALVFNASNLSSWFVRSFTSPEEYLEKVYMQNAEAALSQVLPVYEEQLAQQELQQDFAIGTELHIKPGKQLLGMLTSAEDSEIQMDLSWLSDIRFSVESVSSQGIQENDIGLGLGSQNILLLEQILDLENQKQYFILPELHNDALYTELNSSDAVSAETAKLYADALPSADVIRALVQRYLPIMLGNFASVARSSEQVTVGDMTQELTVLTAYMEQEDLIGLVTEMLTTAKQDQELKSVIEGYGVVYNDMTARSMDAYSDFFEQEYVPEDLYQQFLEQIELELEELQKELDSANAEHHLYFYTYLNSNNRIVGQKLVLSGEDGGFSHITLEDRGRFESTVTLGDLQISGKGTVGDATDCTFTVCQDTQEMATVRLEGTSENGRVTCQAQIKPTAALRSAIAEDMELDDATAAMLSAADMTWMISLEGTDKEGTACATLTVGNDVFLEVSATPRQMDPEQPVVPQNAVCADDEEALSQWILSLRWDTLMEQMTKAGVPQELLLALLLGMQADTY
ncbi:MAG: zinc-ribbon domain-containing protein [Oscillospiraceae bacterium]|nr:zinc-ribbon domain-containing protein [Oscillospiraceae bacterium]